MERVIVRHTAPQFPCGPEQPLLRPPAPSLEQTPVSRNTGGIEYGQAHIRALRSSSTKEPLTLLEEPQYDCSSLKLLLRPSGLIPLPSPENHPMQQCHTKYGRHAITVSQDAENTAALWFYVPESGQGLPQAMSFSLYKIVVIGHCPKPRSVRGFPKSKSPERYSPIPFLSRSNHVR